jgi:hypothetical protein
MFLSYNEKCLLEWKYFVTGPIGQLMQVNGNSVSAVRNAFFSDPEVLLHYIRNDFFPFLALKFV